MNQNQECNRERSTTLEMQPPPPYPTRDYGQVAQHQTIYVVQSNVVDLGTASATTHCITCNMNVTTVVDDSMRDFGWIWCLLCSPPIGCLPCCLNGFRKFTHKCPKCNFVLGVTEPTFTKREKCIIGTTIGITLLICLAPLFMYVILISFYYR